MTQTIDRDEAVAAIDAIVEVKGEDFEYEPLYGQCSYFEPENRGSHEPHEAEWSTPSCIIGHYFKDLGIDSVGELASQTNRSTACNELHFRQISSLLRINGNFDFTDDAVDYLRNVQINQDTGETWGDAVRIAKGYDD